MPGRRVTLTALVQPSEQDVLDYVASNPAAIGYVAFDAWNANPSAHAIAIDDIKPDLADIRSAAYPLMRPLFLVVPRSSSPDIMDFVNFVVEAAGRQIIAEHMALPQ